jgi:hypothetical protein
MKANSFLLLFILALLALSCTEDDGNLTPTSILGEWQLEAIYNDPGDGSGDFEPIESDMLLELLPNGRYTTSNSVCLRPASGDQADTGSYDETTGIITTDLCDPAFPIRFELVDDKLIISHFCIEACQLRFRKV